jgi:hypothetical protein
LLSKPPAKANGIKYARKIFSQKIYRGGLLSRPRQKANELPVLFVFSQRADQRGGTSGSGKHYIFENACPIYLIMPYLSPLN